MKIRFVAIIGMIAMILSSAMPAQAAAADAVQYRQAVPESAAADRKNDFRYLANGWNHRDGSWYYIRGGRAVTGWVKDNGKWYYLSQDGRMKTGWLKDNGKWYYLTKSGAMKTGWLKDEGKWYYLTKSGAMKTGWLKLRGNWYYMNAGGARKTGWLRDNGRWYYLKANGVMKRGWLKLNGRTYYLTKSGARKTGWLKVKGKKYYFGANGVLDTEKSRQANEPVKKQETTAASGRATQTTSGSNAQTAASGSAQTTSVSSAQTTSGSSGQTASKDSGKTETKTETTAEKKTTAVKKKTKGEQVAEYALKFVGNPYVYGGCSLTHGTDCSGFVMLIYQHFGVSLPHYDAAIRQKGTPVDSLAEAKAGDIICYYGHVAIYLGDGRIVHASNSRDGIKISERADYRTLAGIRRIFD